MPQENVVTFANDSKPEIKFGELNAGQIFVCDDGYLCQKLAFLFTDEGNNATTIADPEGDLGGVLFNFDEDDGDRVERVINVKRFEF